MPQPPSARLGLVGPSGTDLIANGDDVIRALIAALDAKTAIISSGTLAARPPSTVGTPGIAGRFYYVQGDATPANNGYLWYDTGTSWSIVGRSLPDVLVSGAAPFVELQETDAPADQQRFRWYSLAGHLLGRFFNDDGTTRFAAIDADSATGVVDFVQNKGATVATYPAATHDKAEPTTLRTVRGTVNADGTIAAGAGFTVTKGAAGIYTINFTDAFSAVPSVMPVCEASIARTSATWTAPTTGSVGIRTFTAADALANTAFSFSAIGPN